MRKLLYLFIVAMGLILPHSGFGTTVQENFVFELIFPLEHRELNLTPPVISATYNGKIIFKKAPWSHPVTDMPAMVTGLKSTSELITLQVRTETGFEKVFQVNLKKGQYIFIYFDLIKHQFSLKQQITPPGYD